MCWWIFGHCWHSVEVFDPKKVIHGDKVTGIEREESRHIPWATKCCHCGKIASFPPDI